MNKILYLLILLALVFNLQTSKFPPLYKGADPLQFNTCPSDAQFCESSPLIAKADLMQLEFASTKAAQIVLKELSSGQVIKMRRLVKASAKVNWNLLEFGPLKQGKEYVLHFSKGIELKPKLAFFNSNNISSEPIPSWLIRILLGLTLALILLKEVRVNNYILFFLLSLLIHFRHDVFFYFDEWDVLEMFSADTFDLLRYRHSEHFLPLFFLFYQLESKIFGLNYSLYLFISIGLHALNALLVYQISKSFFKEHQTRIAKIIAVLFLVSSLHSEALHWAFEQSLLFCSMLILFSVLASINYLRDGKIKDLVKAITSASISPFFFGNGFSAIIVLGLLAFFKCSKEKLIRLSKILIPVSLCFAFWLSFYFSKESSPKLSASLAEIVIKISAYLFSASQLGIVLRSTGAYPDLELQTASSLTSLFSITKFVQSPEVCFAFVGLSICAASLALTYKYQREHLSIWLIGFLLPISQTLLPALARWHYGTAQALSLRYSYLGVFGVFLMLSPCILLLLERSGAVNNYAEKINTGKNLLFVAIFTLHIYLQLSLAQNFRYFSDFGLQHRQYVQQLIDWHCSGAPLELAPTYPETITPGGSQNMILEGVRWLDREPCGFN